MRKIMVKQKFTLDTTEILSDKAFADSNVSKMLKDFLIEGYNPLIDEFAKLYKENPQLDIKDNRVKELMVNLKKMIEDNGNKYEEKIKENDGPSSSMSTHLTFLYKNITENKTIGEALTNLSNNTTGQTKKDFEANRLHFNLIDQDNKPFLLDGKADFAEAIKDRARKENISFTKAFQKALNLTDKQLHLILCRYNQRGIQGSGVAFSKENTSNDPMRFGGEGERSDNIHVIVKNGEVKEATLLENSYTTTQFIENENGDIVKSPYSKTTYQVDISNLEKSTELPIALPIQKSKETITFEALDEEAIYLLPDSLKTRTENNKLLTSVKENAKALSEEKIAELMRTPGIKQELTSSNYSKLSNMITPEVVVHIVKAELNELESSKPNLKNHELANQLQSNLSVIFDKPQMKEDRELAKSINQYVKQQKPNFLTRVSNYIHASFHGINVDQYIERKEKKFFIKTAATLLSNASGTITPQHSIRNILATVKKSR